MRLKQERRRKRKKEGWGIIAVILFFFVVVVVAYGSMSPNEWVRMSTPSCCMCNVTSE
jgi:nitrogen fixation protein FixH